MLPLADRAELECIQLGAADLVPVTVMPSGQAPIVQVQTTTDPTQANLEILWIDWEQALTPAMHEEIMSWLNVDTPETSVQVIQLHNATLYWSLSKIVMLVGRDRMAQLRIPLCESVYVERELQHIENQVRHLWPSWQADSQQAFVVEARDLRKRQQIAKRFVEVMQLRSRLAQMTPFLLRPGIYPATLASQLQERIRERFASSYRLEALEGQLESFERIYDQCSQRYSEWVLANKGFTLEWIIIILLAIQVLLAFTEYLTSVVE